MSTQNKLFGNTNNKNIGITLISEKFSSTTDSFWIVLNPGVVINPFDFVSVDNKNNIKTIGIVKELQRTFILFNSKQNNFFFSFEDNPKSNADIKGTIATIAKIAVMANLHYNNNTLLGQSYDNDIQLGNINKSKSSLSINMPMEEGKPVVFASADEVIESLGIPEMENPIPAGIIEMTNGTCIPIFLDVSYIFGPDTAHANASGISGNIKTSYLLFLLHGAYQSLLNEGIALILFNTKEKGLLYLNDDEDNNKDNYEQKDIDFMNLLNMNINKFQDVKYFLPRGKDGKPNSAHIPQKNYKTYSYELTDVYDRLEMLFPLETAYDPQYNISSIINYIYESWQLLNNNDISNNDISKEVKSWTDLIHFNDYPEEIVTHKATLLRFKGSIQRFVKPATLFVDKKVTSTYLGKEIKQLKSKDIFVIDIAMLSTLEEQAFVIGDVMKNIDEIYSLGPDSSSTSIESDNKNQNFADKDLIIDYNNNSNKANRQVENKNPKYILILIDEINRFLPHLEDHGNSLGIGVSIRSAVSEEILKTVIAGKSRHIALLSAQQFKSQVDPFLNYNTGLHVTSKLGLSELSTPPYSIIDDTTKYSISKLQKGEMILIHPAFKHPIKITIPKMAYKRS